MKSPNYKARKEVYEEMESRKGKTFFPQSSPLSPKNARNTKARNRKKV